jgi:hypothetical protein
MKYVGHNHSVTVTVTITVTPGPCASASLGGLGLVDHVPSGCVAKINIP